MLYKLFYVENKCSNLYISMSILFHLNTPSFSLFLIHGRISISGWKGRERKVSGLRVRREVVLNVTSLWRLYHLTWRAKEEVKRV